MSLLSTSARSHGQFEKDVRQYVADELKGALIPERAIAAALAETSRILSENSHHLTIKTLMPRIEKFALENMTEAERDERTMILLGRLYGSSV